MFKQTMILRSVSVLCSAAIAYGSFANTSPVFAATSQSISRAIQEARVLAPGTNVRVRLDGTKASIATFRNKKANDRDCKIEAVLIGKTIFEKESDNINSITVYFYNSRNPTEYKSISVTKGDVAAFGTGQVSKSELLSSIQIRSGGLKDPAAAIENQLMLTAASKRSDVQISFGKDEINVTTVMPAGSPQREYKYEALRIAEIATSKLGDTSAYKRVNVNFFLPGKKGSFNQVSVPVQQLNVLNNQVLAALKSMNITQKVGKISAKDIEPAQGILLAERTKLLESIIELEEGGAGVAPFVKAFQGIESQVGSGNDEALKKSIDRLAVSVDDQIKRSEDAKNRKLSSTGGNNDPDEPEDSGSSGSGPAKKTRSRGKINRWAFGLFPMPESHILRDPKSYLAECIRNYNAKNTKGKKAENTPEYVYALLWFAEVLKTNDRVDEAKKFEGMAARANARLRASQ